MFVVLAGEADRLTGRAVWSSAFAGSEYARVDDNPQTVDFARDRAQTADAVLVIADEVTGGPLPIHIADSVLDATAPGREVLSAPADASVGERVRGQVQEIEEAWSDLCNGKSPEIPNNGLHEPPLKTLDRFFHRLQKK